MYWWWYGNRSSPIELIGFIRLLLLFSSIKGMSIGHPFFVATRYFSQLLGRLRAMALPAF